jgi:uncharacterized protein YybS (DUF2232 family)
MRRIPGAVVPGALSALFFLSSQWAAPVGFLVCLAAPLPLAFAAWQRGLAAAIGSALLGAGLLWAATGLEGALSFLVHFGAGGVALGFAVRRGRGPEVVVGSYALLSVAAFWLILMVQASGTGAGPLALLAEGMKQSAAHVQALLAQSQQDPEVLASVERWTERFLLAFPGALAALSLLVGWLNGLALRKLLARRGEVLPAWNTWRAREAWIWVLIASGLLLVLSKGSLRLVGLNVFIPALALYFLQGLAVVQHLFETKALPPVIRAVTYTLLIVQFPAALLVAGLGAFDLWLDFRARWSRAPTST